MLGIDFRLSTIMVLERSDGALYDNDAVSAKSISAQVSRNNDVLECDRTLQSAIAMLARRS